jgi:serine protease
VAVIDTGIDYTHPDLADNIWVNEDEIPGNRIDDDKNGYVDDVHGYDFVNNDGDPMDDHFHGTHVAGTIGAVGNNGIGISGVNWSVQIMALKFLDAGGGGFTSDAISALNYAVANGAIASNNSWGGGGFSAAFQTAIQNAASKGHIFVAAAGNDGWNTDHDPFYPSGYNVDNIVSVGATDFRDELAYFSNYGVTSVDLTAPGVGIYSTFPTHMTDAMRDEGFSTNYESISGTSMATPHVTGVIALVATLHPDWSYSQIIEQVLGTVDVVPGAAKTWTGGRLNAAAAVGNPAPDIAGPRVLGNDPFGGVNGIVSQVRLRFNETIDPATLTLEDIVGITGPDGPIEALAIVPVSGTGRQFDVTFAPQATLGAYTLRVGPNISDLTGNLMDQDTDGVGGEDPGDVFEATFSIVDVLNIESTDVPADLHWAMVTSSFLEVTQDATISDLNVTLDISYPYDGDMDIYLVSPEGTRVELSTFNGGLDADFAGTVFDDEGDIPIGGSFAPYSGSHQPDGQLSVFDGENAKGTWTLTVEVWPFSWEGILDGDGWLNAWSIQLEGADGTPTPPPPVGNRAPVANDDAFVGNDVNEDVVLSTAALLANDTDPDGNALTITFFSTPVGGSVTLEPNGVIRFRPAAFFEGQAGFDYVVSDGALTDIGHVSIDIEATFQWHNLRNPLDVDNSGIVGPNDAILIINLLNANGGGTPLESIISGAKPAAYYDVVPNNIVSPRDAIEVINYLNSPASGTRTAAATDGEAAMASRIESAPPVSSLPADGDEVAARASSRAQLALDAHNIDLILAELFLNRGASRRRR